MIIIISAMIEFEQSSYEIFEDIGLDNFAVRVCLDTSNLISERTVRISTSPGTAQGTVCSFKGD